MQYTKQQIQSISISALENRAANRSACELLVEGYADGRPICNCGRAYYTPCGRGIDRDGTIRTDFLDCRNGCSANQLDTSNEIAERVIQELP